MRKAFAILLVLSLSFITKAQEPSEPIKETFTDAEFFMAREEYIDAVGEYLKLYKRGYDNAYFNYRIGVCYLNIPGSKHLSIDYLEKAKTNTVERISEGTLAQTHAPNDVFIFLGNAYRVNNQLQKAIDTYNHYKLTFNKKENIVNIQYVDQQITSCMNALQLMADPVNIEETNVGPPINNASDNFRPAISGNRQRIAFMNSLAFYDAVYVSENINGKWSRPENITPQIQSDGDQYVTSLSFDGNTMLLARDDKFDSDILISYFKDGVWTKSSALPKPINSKYWESHGSFSPDGNTIYFTSNRPGGVGEMDIFYSTKGVSGEWSEPVSLGSAVNSPLNEDYPFVSPEGNRLYFSSQGHYNIGGYDIFYSDRQPDGSWSAPVNIGYPVSTPDDDLFYCPIDTNQGVYYRYTSTGYGRQDIYGIKLLPPALPDALAGDTASKEPTTAALPKDEPHADGTAPTESVRRNVQLSPVYYRFNSFELTELSREKLAKIVALLKEFPELTITLTGFTDAIGSAQYNQVLSEKRANNARDFLVANGIDINRITTAGKGASGYIAINNNTDGTDNPDGRFFNRRVEIRFANLTGNLKIDIMQEVPENLRIKP